MESILKEQDKEKKAARVLLLQCSIEAYETMLVALNDAVLNTFLSRLLV